MAGFSAFDPGKGLISVFILLVIVTSCVYADDDDNNEGGVECFYELETVGYITYLGSFPCKYGCCGTTENQRCCTKKERYPDYEQGKSWRIAAVVVISILAIVAIALVIMCIMKKKNKKKMTVYDVQGDQRNRGSHKPGDEFASVGPPSNPRSNPYVIPTAPSTRTMPPPYSFMASGEVCTPGIPPIATANIPAPNQAPPAYSE